MWLVKFSKDWTDEFQAEGLTILTDEGKANLEKLVEEGFDFYFGSNEGFDAGEIELDDFEFIAITQEDADRLRTLIPDLVDGSYGQMIDEDYILEALSNNIE